MIDEDVVVVGGGIAGSVAALAASRARSDVSVRLVTKAETTLDSASGLIDVLGYTPDGEGPVADPFRAVPDLPESHPYRTIGTGRLRDGLALFDDVTGRTYSGEGTDRNALVPTYAGTLKPTARYPRSVKPGLASAKRSTLLVGFEALTAFDAQFAADRLSERLPYRLTGTSVNVPLAGGEEVDPAIRYARAFDRQESTVDGEPLPDAIADRISYLSPTTERIGFPAVLGLEDTIPVRARLADRIDEEVFEVPMGPPSVPGRRLEGLLRDALAGGDVTVDTGTPVVDYDASDGRVESVAVEREGDRTRATASQFVLATGGLAGGGVQTGREGVREPLFDCHVEAAPDRYDWFRDDPLGDHPFAHFGVDVDDQLHPLTASGRPEFDNLRAAGSVLGGYNFAAEKSGGGVSIGTGYVAGRLAAEDVA